MLDASSGTGPRMAYPGLSHCASSKARVNGFIFSAALELANCKVWVNGVEMGMIRTPAMGNLVDGTHCAVIARGIPLDRLDEPEDIAGPMLFIASKQASYIIGQTIVVDGGATLPETHAVLD